MSIPNLDLLPEEERQELRRRLRMLEARMPRQCEHIKSNGEFCGSPALRQRNYCYFHLTQIGRQLRNSHPSNSGLGGAPTQSHAEPAHSKRTNEWGTRDSHASNPGLGGAPTASARLELPTLEDANSIQIALMQVIDAIVNERLDNKRAGLILYALQTASSNLQHGANFSLPTATTVAGQYDAFEEDFELGEEAAHLKVEEPAVEEEGAAPQPKREVAVTETEGQLRILKWFGAPAKAEEQGEGAAEDAGLDDGEEGEHEFCDPVTRFFCSLQGPLSQPGNGWASSRVERVGLSQKVAAAPRLAQRKGEPGAQGEEEDAA